MKTLVTLSYIFLAIVGLYGGIFLGWVLYHVIKNWRWDFFFVVVIGLAIIAAVIIIEEHEKIKGGPNDPSRDA